MLFIPLLTLFSAAWAQTPTEEFLVISCNDGDTCRAKGSSGVMFKIRLAGIDAPETSHGKKGNKTEGQPMALEAKDFLNNMVKGKKVRVQFYGNDVYDRNLGEIFVGEENINLKMVSSGQAEVYVGKPPKGLNIDMYLKAEADAKKTKVGVWSLPNYQSPKNFRKKNAK